MINESAIVEENDIQVEDGIDQEPIEDDYQIEEPLDDEDENTEFQVPVIDSIDDEDDSMVENQPSDGQKSDKKEQTEPEQKVDKQETQKQAEPESTKKAIGSELIAKAKGLGITDDDIAMFDRPDQLERLCSLVEPNVNKDEKQESDSENSLKAAEDTAAVEELLDPSVYDPNICKAVNSTAGQIKQLRAALEDITASIARQGQESFERSFETMISSLGDEFADTLGKGSLEDIGTGSEYFKNRCDVIDEMNAIAAGYAQTGKKVPTQKQLFSRAVNSLYGDKIKASAKKQIASQLEKRSSQIISRPSGSKGKDTLTPERRAANAVAQKLREFGAYDNNEIEEDF